MGAHEDVVQVDARVEERAARLDAVGSVGEGLLGLLDLAQQLLALCRGFERVSPVARRAAAAEGRGGRTEELYATVALCHLLLDVGLLGLDELCLEEGEAALTRGADVRVEVLLRGGGSGSVSTRT